MKQNSGQMMVQPMFFAYALAVGIGALLFHDVLVNAGVSEFYATIIAPLSILVFWALVGVFLHPEVFLKDTIED